MKPRRLQIRAILTKWNCELEPIKLLMITTGRCTALCFVEPVQLKATNASHSGASYVNVLTDREHQEGHFHHARSFSHRLPDTVSTGLRLPGNRLQSEDCRGTGRGELRTGRMECSASFVWNWDAAFTVFFLFFSSSVILIPFFSPNCSTLLLHIIKGQGKK